MTTIVISFIFRKNSVVEALSCEGMTTRIATCPINQYVVEALSCEGMTTYPFPEYFPLVKSCRSPLLRGYDNRNSLHTSEVRWMERKYGEKQRSPSPRQKRRDKQALLFIPPTIKNERRPLPCNIKYVYLSKPIIPDYRHKKNEYITRQS